MDHHNNFPQNDIDNVKHKETNILSFSNKKKGIHASTKIKFEISKILEHR